MTKMIVVEDLARIEAMERRIAALQAQLDELSQRLASPAEAPKPTSQFLLTPRGVAARWRLSPNTIRAAIHSGALRAMENAHQRGGKAGVLIEPSDVEAWLRRRKTPRQSRMDGSSAA